jgi:hypothetical protein
MERSLGQQGENKMCNNLIRFEDVQGDISFVKASAIDCIVSAEHKVPVEVDDKGQPTSDETKLKFFAVAILGNGRQVLETFDSKSDRDAKLDSIKKLMI